MLIRYELGIPLTSDDGSDPGSSIQSSNSDAVPKYGQWNSDSNATDSVSKDYRIGAKQIDGQSKFDFREGDSLFSWFCFILTSISCWILFEYSSFTIGKLILCRNAADPSHRCWWAEWFQFFLIAMIYAPDFCWTSYFPFYVLLYQVDWSVLLRRT